MSTAASPTTADPAARQAPARPPELRARDRIGGTAALLGLLLLLLLASAWHVTQGTSGLGALDLLDMFGDSERAQEVRDVVLGSRVPRLTAGITVGVCLGAAGALFQSVARNPMASPDTLAVTAGAAFAVTLVSALGLGVPVWASTIVAFCGGLAAAGLVLLLSGGAGTSTTRLILAGSATAMALGSGTATLLILFETETVGLFAWGSGSLSQLGMRAFVQVAPVVLLALVVGLVIARRLDVLGLGDDTAGVLGVPVRSTRTIAVLAAVGMSAAAVTLAGPIGFVGLCAPVGARLLARWVPALHKHAALIPASALVGAIVVIVSDVGIRALLGADEAVEIPTGVTTTLLGATVLVILARQSRDSGPTRTPPTARVGVRGERRFVLMLVLAGLVAVTTAVGGLLAGYVWLRTGDVGVWLGGDAHPIVASALDERAPRVLAALVGGAGLALAGFLVQGTCRNPLADPGIIGISGGAGLGAVIVVTMGLGGRGTMVLAAVAAALLTFATVYGLSWRRGLDSDRLVLIGVGVSALTAGVSAFLLLRVNPWDTPAIFTWLSGTTYGRSWSEVLPALVALVLVAPVALGARREIDLLGVDEDTPRLTGVGVGRARLVLLTCAACLTALSVTAVGVVGFVGLVAPHAARGLVGARSARALPVTILLGAALLGVADAVGRTVIAPDEIPCGLVVALIGAPYFVYLLARSR